MFDYDAAFSRNLGWTTDWEQAALRGKRVAIAGLGGVGGAHLLTLARLGIGAFSIADFDTFAPANLNRQAGANAATMGRAKVDVLAEMALAINPELDLARFGEGVTEANLDRFLEGCDLFVDGLDFFALEIRAHVFARAAELGIPAFTAAPIGMGVGFLAFQPGGQSFEQYFRLEGQGREERYLRFLLGVAPAGLHRTYLADDSRVDLPRHRGPSTVAACELCAGMMATQVLKQLLGRGGVPSAPVHVTFDAYRVRVAETRLRWGMAGPLQRLKLMVGRRVYAGMAARAPAAEDSEPAGTVLEAILEAARWAPSGDNVQPWRFEIVDADRLRIHLASEVGENPYEYRGGEPTLLAAGMLLESLRIAATRYGRGIAWSVSGTGPWMIEVCMAPDAAVRGDPLLTALPMRSVARGALGIRALTEADKAALTAALGPGLAVTWFEDWRARLAVARLGARATNIRLRAPETFAVHRRVVDWARRYSPDGLPSVALGLNAPTLRIMRWGMASWARMRRINAVLGTGAAQLQLDLWPGLGCAAYFAVRVVGPEAERREAALLGHGMALQRFWLTATARGLAMQPALATLAFAGYGASGASFTTEPGLGVLAERLAGETARVVGPLEGLLFLGRLGRVRAGMPGARSVRRRRAELMLGEPVSADAFPGGIKL